jgi:ribonucleoside-diphosphate reductase alpha chain
METVSAIRATLASPAFPNPAAPVEIRSYAPGEVRVIRRNGKVTGFDAGKISVAIAKAFLAVEGHSAAASRRIHETVEELTDQVVRALFRRLPSGGTIHIEDIQDQVELALMRSEHQKIARAYVLYREEHARLRAEKAKDAQDAQDADPMQVTLADGTRRPLDEARLRRVVAEACAGLAHVDGGWIIEETRRNLFDGVPEKDVALALVMTARTRIEQEPNYSQVSARLLLDTVRREALSFLGHGKHAATQAEMAERYPEYFADYVKRGVELELLSPELARYDLERLGTALQSERDLQFTYLGLQTLYDRYFIHSNDGQRFELPQAFFMRVAMGLAIAEIDREERAVEFYHLLSSFDFMSSTPTLFNAGTLRPQLSSCYLTSVPDNLEGIYSAIKDNALLSKYAGGLGNDWTRVRGLGAYIKGTNGKSQGVIPFLKVANDTAVAVNQCFAPETPIFTADGVKAMRDIEIGDLALGISGTYREVTDKMVYNQRDPMVSVDVKHGIEPLRVTAGHPFWAIAGVPMEQSDARTLAWLEKGKVGPAWIEAGQLKKGDYVGQAIPREIIPVPAFDEDDARLYGILLGDGHLSKDGKEWGVSGNPQRDEHLEFVRAYLDEKGIHFWETCWGETYGQIRWATGLGALRDGTTGRIVGTSAQSLPFLREDLYDDQGRKRISRRFSHLPPAQTLALIKGLLETDGGVSRGKEIYFTNISQALAEGLRYQLLRLGIPAAGQYRERDNAHIGLRSDGSEIQFNGVCKAYDLRIPAAPEIAALVKCREIAKRNWIVHNGCVFSRVRKVEPMAPCPFVIDLKVEGDESYMTANALVHNGGKRLGAVCAYLETWHLDIEEFLDLRKNTGDDRRRTHDMNTANWVPDLFMKRVAEEGPWTLFSPDDVPDLHDATGAAFEKAYLAYEEKIERGEISLYKRIPALTLWRKMLSMLFETGHPWIAFKDPCNLRSPQQHVGVVHSSNLCTEIALNTSDNEIAVCFPKGTSILTSDGQKPIEECDGANVYVPFSADFRVQQRFLKAKLIPQGRKQVYELKTKNGIVIEATEDHPFLVQWPVVRDEPKAYEWKKLKELNVGDFLACPLTGPVFADTGIQDEDFTAAGWMQGDGWMTSSYGVCFGAHETHAQAFVLPILDRWHQESELGHNAPHANPPTPYVQPNGVVTWHTQRQGFIAHVKNRFGFDKATGSDKRIGRPVKAAAPNQIASFLSGLYSADGCVMHDKRRAKGGVIISLASASLTLLRDVQMLLKPFGVHGRIRGCHVAGREGRWQGQLEILGGFSILNFARFIGFSLSPAKQQKLAEALPLLSTKSALQHTAIVSITVKDNQEVFDLALEEDHNFLANGLSVHNCNLGSVNLAAHIVENGALDSEKLAKTVSIAMRMLDNVIDINYYSVPQARRANLRHRPVGLGIMGFQDALYKLRIPYASEAAVQFADRSMELVSYHAIRASADLAEERGAYSTFEGSLWSKGILPIDSIELLEQGRGDYLQQDRSQTLDWDALRERVKTIGLRNSNTMAIAPTATISNIVGVSQSIEPTYQNLFVKSNLSGEFTVVNPFLVRDLKERQLWDAVMINDLKYYDGSVSKIERIPEDLKQLYATAFEIDPRWLVEAASRRQKWIDQGQSLNLYMSEPNGKKLDALYKLAWVRGLKTTYYLRSMGATHVEKSTLADGKLNKVRVDALEEMPPPKLCLIDNPECEACQ